MLEKFDYKSTFGNGALGHVATLFNGVQQIMNYIEANITDQIARNSAIDFMSKLLQDEKK